MRQFTGFPILRVDHFPCSEQSFAVGRPSEKPRTRYPLISDPCAYLELLRRFRRVLRLDYEELAFEYFPREVPSDGDGKLLAIRRKLQEL